MSTLRFHTLDVFTDRRFGGNPLAVVLDGGDLDGPTMQLIAREFNLSETAFVLPVSDAGATHRVRIFTPVRELPFAGHPTLGTAILLARLEAAHPNPGGEALVVLEEGVGLVPVSVRSTGGETWFGQFTAARLPEPGPPAPEVASLASALGLTPGEIMTGDGDRPEAYSCGLPYLMVPVRDRAALARVCVVEEHWRRSLRDYWAPDMYVFCRDTGQPDSAIRARMFAPASGIVEDPATGSAAAAMAGYLHARDGGSGTLRWTLEQGVEMGRPSLLYLEADARGGSITEVRVGGGAVPVLEGVLAL